MIIDLKGHAALITGSSKGVGRAIAEAFAEAGADLVLHGRGGEAELADAVETCRARGVNVASLEADLAIAEERVIDALFEHAIAAMPKLDILVNNAGQFFDVPLFRIGQ